MSVGEDPFPDLDPYPEGLDFWERDHLGGLFSQAAHGDCASHVAMPRPNSSEIAGAQDLPSEATPDDTERQYFWAGDSSWNRDGDRFDAPALGDRLADTVADVNNPLLDDSTVAFDIFPTQTGGDYTSRVIVENGKVTDYTVALPFFPIEDYVGKYKFIQLRYLLKRDAPLLRPHNTATIRGGVPYLYYGRDSTPSAPSGALAGLVADIVEAYVGESTGDTLDGYPEDY
ncbi:hypothetical protein [Halobacterium jilantaiense]|uniref:Uncharacterized protein n=1 Tax=Halobacterium jilantaiense TaxID=355548 RepID=A0A1I0Q0U7_9EURY|nr:hypothetical protein [Halobacterium jilantaiense]SEW20529.1 hypothetical protein SAMN04487945_2163 [Halobacterium jilantaiense]